MNTTAIYIKTDPKVKRQAQEVAKNLGFSLSSLLNAWMRQFIKTKTVTFSVFDERPNERLKKIFHQADKDLKMGKASPTFDTGEEAVAWLEKQGI